MYYKSKMLLPFILLVSLGLSKQFRNFDLNVITFLKVIFICSLWFCLIRFLFLGAFWSNMDVKIWLKILNILFRAYNLIMNKITRSLMDFVNKIKRCKIWLKLFISYFFLLEILPILHLFSTSYIFWFYSQCPSSFWLSYSLT